MALDLVELTTEETFLLADGDTLFLHMQGVGSRLVFSFKLMDGTGSATLESAIESREYAEEDDIVNADILWEFPKIDGVSVPSLASNIQSASAECPSLVKIVNTSGDGSEVRFSFRINRE